MRASGHPQPSRPGAAQQQRTSVPNDVRQSRPSPPPPGVISARDSAAIQAKCCGEMTDAASGTGRLRCWRGVMLLWFVLTAASLLFVAVDIRTTPESPVLKWGFVLVTAI